MEFFEATEQQKKLANIGRSMMDWSENFGSNYGLGQLKDPGLRILNELSHVGSMLTHFGTPYGTTASSFSEEDQQLIAMFMDGRINRAYVEEAV
jgi:hypothetical protein